LSQQTLDFEEIRWTCPSDTEYNLHSLAFPAGAGLTSGEMDDGMAALAWTLGAFM
jgi:hypothetical protein